MKLLYSLLRKRSPTKGLWRSDMLLNEKGFYFTVLMFGIFAVVSVQKSVRDRADGFPVTDIFYGICLVPRMARKHL